MSGHPSHVPRSHRELHRGPKCQLTRACRTHFGIPLPRSVAREGIQREAPMVAFACARRAHVGAPLIRLVAP
eukprot:6537276-Pyramimonas_sp.AAC.1